ncbi:MAG: hypothetical protein LZF62_140007 [Nitrospira sp.]|nr:MAG: hypothetical protein LZF62_140007 [Nitrospira sp.]
MTRLKYWPSLSYFDHMNQVKRGLRPRSPRPSGPLVRNGRAASLGGDPALVIVPIDSVSRVTRLVTKNRKSGWCEQSHNSYLISL